MKGLDIVEFESLYNEIKGEIEMAPVNNDGYFGQPQSSSQQISINGEGNQLNVNNSGKLDISANHNSNSVNGQGKYNKAGIITAIIAAAGTIIAALIGLFKK